ncbi:hypothetical protein F4V89_29795, partial [Neorhizobium galegae]
MAKNSGIAYARGALKFFPRRREGEKLGEMAQHWMDASLSFGVPQEFVVDRDGRIASIGDSDGSCPRTWCSRVAVVTSVF